MTDTTDVEPAVDIPTAIELLKKLRPAGPWVLTAIIPDGATDTITATTTAKAEAFVRKHNGKKNIYYSVNPTRTVMTKKAAKTDIASIEFLLSDLDPNEGETPEDAKARYLATLEDQHPKDTGVVDSGNGIQVLWRLAEPIMLAEPLTVTDDEGKTKKVFPEETAKQIADVEARVKALMERMGSIAGTQNIDRILRLPGTVNLPNAKKLRDGRVACPTKLIRFTDNTCSLEDFPVPVVAEATATTTTTPAPSSDAPPLDWTTVATHAGWLRTVADLPSDFNTKGKMIVAHSGTLADLNADILQAGLIEKKYNSWSSVTLALAAIFKADGRYPREQIAAALLCNLACNKHITKERDQDIRQRAVERALAHSHVPTVQRIADVLNWRERRVNGSPLPSMHNAILAIQTLGVRCSHDIFHNTLHMAVDDDRAELASIIGEVTDNTVFLLRHIVSEVFGIDFLAVPMREAVTTLALENGFDPVCDMLKQAEANYDGSERLDRMAVDYFNGEDTPLNRACVRKTMIAAARRARRPGCKFDNILVLESKEGWNKSTAWRVLAGDDNFSDQSILGIREKEVQELLGAVWIHESSDLSGMRKAEVQSVKAFASRQVDMARPAYGHFLKKQPRHAINTATTNDDEYLQSQTGNRRFWGLKVLRSIDIDKLQRDRSQLWGEAAKYESAGESLTIPETLWAAATEEQEKRRTKDPWESIVENLPYSTGSDYSGDPRKIIHVERDRELVSSSDVLTFVLRVPIAQQKIADTMRLATVMKRAGWDRPPNGRATIDGKQVRAFWRPRPDAENAPF